jgi:hypothetical protein
MSAQSDSAINLQFVRDSVDDVRVWYLAADTTGARDAAADQTCQTIEIRIGRTTERDIRDILDEIFSMLMRRGTISPGSLLILSVRDGDRLAGEWCGGSDAVSTLVRLSSMVRNGGRQQRLRLLLLGWSKGRIFDRVLAL